ncbi:hypothetical protein TSMEX_009880 [Taenia solium]|eukprot:TsM_000778400 transcript=TsM_000778400 gene=TsM_000778400
MTVTLMGNMSSELKWMIFMGPGDIVPITVVFLVNNVWNDLTMEVRNILLHKVLTLTVKQKEAIDFYTCKVGDKYLTHTIDWNRFRACAALLLSKYFVENIFLFLPRLHFALTLKFLF